MFEHYRQPLLPPRKFAIRMAKNVLLSFGILLAIILIGTLSFHAVEGYSLIDSFLNSVMIMTGVGTIGILTTNAGKILTGIYSLTSTLVFFAVLAIVFTPLLHRLLHKFHMDIDKKN